MSKIFATAAMVVGGIALAATGVGAVALGGLAGTLTVAGVSTTTLFAVAGGLEVGSMLLTKQPKGSGSGEQSQWKADPQAGIPYAFGRTRVGGNIVYRRAYGDTNKWQEIITVLSAGGPVQSIDQLYIDNTAYSVGADTTVNYDYGYVFERRQLGHVPEATALQVGQGGYPPGWDATCKLSGYAAAAMQFVFDTKGKTTLTSTPQVAWLGHWVSTYDPRKDSTYPGGAGSHRWNDESTWEWSENPFLHALTWLIGRHANGKLIIGGGFSIDAIIVSQFVEGANIADTNGWTIGGQTDTTAGRYDTFKAMLQAGSAEPLELGAQIGCLINTPRVSLATITVDDVMGDASVAATQTKKSRINTIVPTWRDEGSNWEMVPAAPVVVPEHVAFDKKGRSKAVTYSYVQNLKQVATLARYDIENSREFGPISLPLKLRWMGYQPGDCVTANLPEVGLDNQLILITNRSLSPSDAIVTMTARSETPAKHAFALGQTTTAPPTASVGGPVLVPTPGANSWAIVADAISSNGTTIPALVITGAADSSVIDAIVFEYRVANSGLGADDGWQTYGWASPSAQECVITGLKDGAAYEVSISYRKGSASSLARLILGPSTVSSTAIPWSGIGGDGKPEDGATRNVFTGPYDPNRIYKYGDEVSDQLAVWRYISILSEKGNAPPALPAESNAFWSLFVQGASQEIIDAVAGMVSDQVLARSEKLALINDIAAIQSEEPKLVARATGLGLSTTGYVAAYSALMTFLSGLSPTWDDTSQDTPLPDKTTLTARVEAYFSQRDALTGTINDQADQEIAITSEAAAAAKAAADAANTLAGTANAAASLGAQMAADIADNGKFSPAEKKRWVERINSLNGTVASEIAQGNQLGLQAQTGALQTAYNNLISYLNSVGYSDVGHTSSINSGTFKANVAAFDNAETNLAVAAQAYAQSMSVITTSNLIVDPLFQRPTDAGSWQGPPASTSGGQDDRLGRRAYFNASSGDVAWATPTFQCVGTDRLDINFDWFCSSGVAGVNGGTSFGIWASGFDSNGNALWNNAVTVPFSGTKNQWLKQTGSIIVANMPSGANTTKVFLYVQAQGHSGGAVYIRNPRVVKAAAANALLGANGRGLSSTLNSTNGVVGVRALNLSGFQLSFTDTGGGGTVNVGAATYELDTGITINYPSGSFPGAAYSTTYFVWRYDPNLDGGSGYGISTNLSDVNSPQNVYLGYLTTPSAGGTGGGGGGWGSGNCVDPDMFVEVEGRGPVRAAEIVAGDRILCLTEDHAGFEFVDVEANVLDENWKVELKTESGVRLRLSINTPIPRQDGGYNIAAHAPYAAVPIRDGDMAGPDWQRVSMMPLHRGPVARISCHERVYAAGSEPGRYILTHNTTVKP
ncbi:MAG TPA: Hint domain-containing protein [Rhizomicrobium sp.]|jgi:hypothetical protein|nr:Hint domain-containing protein [Rhizomicrobium sp.]